MTDTSAESQKKSLKIPPGSLAQHLGQGAVPPSSTQQESESSLTHWRQSAMLCLLVTNLHKFITTSDALYLAYSHTVDDCEKAGFESEEIKRILGFATKQGVEARRTDPFVNLFGDDVNFNVQSILSGISGTPQSAQKARKGNVRAVSRS